MHVLDIVLRINLKVAHGCIRAARRVEGLVRDDVALVAVLRHDVHGAGSLVIVDLVGSLRSQDGLHVGHDRAVVVEVVLIAVDIVPAACRLAVNEVVLDIVEEAPARVRSAAVGGVVNARAVAVSALILADHQVLRSIGEVLGVVPEANADADNVAVGAHGAGRLAVLCPVKDGAVVQHDLVVDIVVAVRHTLCANLDGLNLCAVLVVGRDFLRRCPGAPTVLVGVDAVVHACDTGVNHVELREAVCRKETLARVIRRGVADHVAGRIAHLVGRNLHLV